MLDAEVKRLRMEDALTGEAGHRRRQIVGGLYRRATGRNR
jgi:hypothetical protein